MGWNEELAADLPKVWLRCDDLQDALLHDYGADCDNQWIACDTCQAEEPGYGDRAGHAFRFQRANGDWLEFSACGFDSERGAAVEVLLKDTTLEFLIKFDSAAGYVTQHLISDGGAGGTDLHFDPDVSTPANGLTMDLAIPHTGDDLYATIADDLLAWDTWHHIVIVCPADGIAVTAPVVYYNGTAISWTGNNTLTTPTGGTLGSGPLDLGRLDNGTAYLDAWLDEIAHYDSVLSAARVAAHFANVGIYGAGGETQVYTLDLPAFQTLFTQVYTLALPKFETTRLQVYTLDLPAFQAQFTQVYTLALPKFQTAFGSLQAGGRWSLRVWVNGFDYGPHLVGVTRIEAEENTATLADFTVTAAAGSINPADWLDHLIIIQFVDDAGAAWTRFVGRVETMDFQPDGHRVSVRASSGLQSFLEGMTRDQILALIPGYWSEFVFDPTADGYQYALDVLSTVPNEIHVDPLGFLVSVDMAAKAVADIVIDDEGRLDQAARFQRMKARDILNEVQISFGFRFPVLRQRDVSNRFVADPSIWCEYLLEGFELCQREMVASAAAAHGWQPTPPSFEPIPGPGSYGCGLSQPTIWVAGQDLSAYCLSAYWLSSKRWAQQVEESYTLTVRAPQSIQAFGSISLAESYGIDSGYDPSDWEESIINGEVTPGASQVPGGSDWVVPADSETPKSRAAMEAAQVVVMNKASAEILRRHRANTLSLALVYRPDISLDKTLEIDSTRIQAKGKLRAYIETFDHDQGVPLLDVSLAISRRGGAGMVEASALAAAVAPAAPAEPGGPYTIGMSYHIGGRPGSPPDTDDLAGYITNYLTSTVPPDQRYTRRFNAPTLEIEAAARDPQARPTAQVYLVDIPDDSLIFTVV